MTTRVGEDVGRMKIKGRRFEGINKARSSGRVEGIWRDRREEAEELGRGSQGAERVSWLSHPPKHWSFIAMLHSPLEMLIAFGSLCK